MSNEAERFNVEGLTVRICYDEGQGADPRDCDQLGTMVCWHPDYVLGDEQIAAASGAVHRDRHGSASKLFQTEGGRSDFGSMETIERYLRVMRGAVAILPLYLLDHSGISMSAGSNTVGRGDTAIPGGGRDSWGNARGWDTTMVGFIYTTRERIEELCGNPVREGDEFYCPRDYEGTALQWMVEQLRGEVEEYDSFLRGDVYYYVIEDEDGEVLDSCGGFIGCEHVEAEARESAEACAHERSVEVEPDMEMASFAASR